LKKTQEWIAIELRTALSGDEISQPPKEQGLPYERKKNKKRQGSTMLSGWARNSTADAAVHTNREGYAMPE